MKPKQGLPGRKLSFIGVVILLALESTAYAATPTLPSLPDSISPGGALPSLDKIPKRRIETAPQVPSAAPEQQHKVPDSGVRMIVKAFVLDGVVDRPKEGISLEDLQNQVESIRQAHPKGFTISELQDITDIITQKYRSAGYILARAYIPEQKVTDNRVVISVLEGKLEKVVFKNNHDYSEAMLLKPFADQVGEPVNRRDIERALLQLSDYPGLKFTSVFAPGDTQGTAQLDINVEDEKSVEGTAWLDNYGSEYTGEYRFWVNAALNNPTGAADKISAQVLTSFGRKNAGDSKYYALSYQRPVIDPSYLFSFDVNKNKFNVGGIFKDLGLKGDSNTMDFGLLKKFVRSRKMNFNGQVTLASKSSSTDISGVTLGKDDLTVLLFGTNLDYRDTLAGYSQMSLSYSKGLAGVLGAMDSSGNGQSSRVNSSGEHAGGNFSKINLSLARWQSMNFDTKLIDQTLLARLDMQSSSDMLVSMEQMSLGGPNSVRAYSPSEYLVDKGMFFSLEWIAKASDAAKGKLFQDLQVSAFYDYAMGKLNDPLINDVSSPRIKGIGLSAQISPDNEYIARLELAKPMGDPKPANNRSIQYFFKLGYMF